MDTNATDSASRVTRSLRKRIASVDSENSSRPGTPVPSKLVSISEITASPSRPTRMTRRNSTSGVATPVKTPAKRVAATSSIIVENAVTPARRSTRRRSISVHENDEISHTGLKVPSFAALDEENAANEQNPNRVTRSQSKSPQQIKSLKASSPSPKLTKSPNENKNKELEEEIADTEQYTSTATRSQSKSPLQIKSSRASSPSLKHTKSPKENKNKEPEEEIAATEQYTSTVTRSQSKSPQQIKSSKASSPSAKLTKSPNETENKEMEEEISAIEEYTSTVTRSQSKSPQQIKSSKASSPSPKLTKSPNEIKNKEPEEEIASTEQYTSTVTRSQSKSPQQIKSSKASSPSPKLTKSPNEIKNKEPVEEIAATEQYTSTVTRSQSKSPQQIKSSKASSPSAKLTKSPNETENKEMEEEISAIEEYTSTVTRSQSKSPHQIKSSKALSPSPKQTKSLNKNKNKELEQKKKRKSGPKSKTGCHEDVSDVETSVLEYEVEEIKNKSSNITIIVLTDDESNQTIMETIEEDKTPQGTDKFALEEIDSQLSDAINVTKNELLNNNETQMEENTNKSNSNMHCTVQETNSTTATATDINILKEPIGVTSDHKESEETISQSQTESINNAEEQIQHTLTDHNPENTIDDMMNEELEYGAKNLQENEINSSIDKNVANKIEIISVSTLTPYSGVNKEDSNVSNCKASSRKVDFASSPSNDMIIKNVYPKTPAFMKTTNCFKDANSSRDNDGSFKAEHKTMAIHSENHQDNNIAINTEKVENKQDEFSQIEAKVTPMRGLKSARSLQIAQSSTPINIEASNPEELLPEEENHITEAEDTPLNEEMENKTTEAHSTDDEEVKWINPSVKCATAEGSKLDAVVTRNDTSSNNCRDNIDTSVEHVKTNKKKKSIIFSSEDEGEDVEREQDDKYDDDDGECELAAGEKPYKRKHDFHDDEAMEVDDYESGDSMDSEERKEIEENEIPVDGESIGSNTTDDEHEEYVDEEEDSDNADSFIVSDNEELECSESSDEDEPIDEDVDDHNRDKKKTYKRLQRQMESSSSSDDEVEILTSEEKLKLEFSDEENINEEKPMKSELNSGEFHIDSKNLLGKSSENIILDTSKLSDSALRMHCTSESESDEEEVDGANNYMLRKEILRKLNQSDRFNKSVRDLNTETDTSPAELEAKIIPEIIQENNIDEKLESSDEGLTTSTSPEEGTFKTRNISKLRSESHLGEVSVTSESDADKENGHKSLNLPYDRMPDSGLSVSFGNYKNVKNRSKGRQEWQRSFTIDVTVNCGDLETAVTDVKLKEETVSASSSTDDRETEVLNGEDLRYLENIKHMPLPLGNPLIRTRRQSLALPTNPDMEICSSHGGATSKKTKRKSLGILSGSDFNPSQSFIDSIELHKSELNRQVAKRKRLSKSFCGASEALDNSIIDIDVRHLHKRSKLIGENNIAESHHDSIEHINTSKLSTKICSTPHVKTDKNDSNNNIQRILTRCDEILEAANRAKLESKINNKQSKGKISKKLRKKSILTLPQETVPEDALRKVSKEIKRKVKTKTALSQAIKAADVILGKKKQTQQQMEEKDEIVSKQLPPDVLEAIEKTSSMKKMCKKGNTGNVHTTLTSAGKFMDMPQTPEKKKRKPTYIQLPTGKVSVEPVTPKKRSVLAFNGTEFRESPVTPYATGFKVRQIPLTEDNNSSSLCLKNGKRKRHHEEKPKDRTLPKSQWTQSGLFIEEDISKNRRIVRSETAHVCGGYPKTKNEELTAINRNFKENAMMRPDIKRSTKREILQLKERRQMQGHY
ncbi:protein slender lobes [Calliphora vicina]|uniref:protein slender lobes n=1 Tax=Calliphora vicina TaxID=7373 RepID=UPI00325BB6E3